MAPSKGNKTANTIISPIIAAAAVLPGIGGGAPSTPTGRRRHHITKALMQTVISPSAVSRLIS